MEDKELIKTVLTLLIDGRVGSSGTTHIVSEKSNAGLFKLYNSTGNVCNTLHKLVTTLVLTYSHIFSLYGLSEDDGNIFYKGRFVIYGY